MRRFILGEPATRASQDAGIEARIDRGQHPERHELRGPSSLRLRETAASLRSPVRLNSTTPTNPRGPQPDHQRHGLHFDRVQDVMLAPIMTNAETI